MNAHTIFRTLLLLALVGGSTSIFAEANTNGDGSEPKQLNETLESSVYVSETLADFERDTRESIPVDPWPAPESDQAIIQTGMQTCSNEGLTKFWADNKTYNVFQINLNQVIRRQLADMVKTGLRRTTMTTNRRVISQRKMEGNQSGAKTNVLFSLIYWTTAQHANPGLMAKSHQDHKDLKKMHIPSLKYTNAYLKGLTDNTYSKKVQDSFFTILNTKNQNTAGDPVYKYESDYAMINLPIGLSPELSRVNTLAYSWSTSSSFGDAMLTFPEYFNTKSTGPDHPHPLARTEINKDTNWINKYFPPDREDDKIIARHNKFIIKRYADVVFGGYKKGLSDPDESPYLPWRSEKFRGEQATYPLTHYPEIEVPPIYVTHFAVQMCSEFRPAMPTVNNNKFNVTAASVIRDLGYLSEQGLDWYKEIEKSNSNNLLLSDTYKKLLEDKDNSTKKIGFNDSNKGFTKKFNEKTKDLDSSVTSNYLSPFSLLSRLANIHHQAITFVMGDGDPDKPDKQWIDTVKARFEANKSDLEWLKDSAKDEDVKDAVKEWETLKSRFEALKDFKNQMGNAFADDALKIIDKYDNYFGDQTRNGREGMWQESRQNITPKAAILEYALTCFDIKNSLGKAYKKAIGRRKKAELRFTKVDDSVSRKKIEINPADLSGKKMVDDTYKANFHGWWEHTDLGFSCRLLEKIVKKNIQDKNENDVDISRNNIQEIWIMGSFSDITKVNAKITAHDLLSGEVYKQSNNIGKKLTNLNRYSIYRGLLKKFVYGNEQTITERNFKTFRPDIVYNKNYRATLIELGKNYVNLIKTIERAWEDLKKVQDYSQELADAFDSVAKFDHLQMLLNFTPHFNATCANPTTQKIGSFQHEEFGHLHASTILDTFQKFATNPKIGHDHQTMISNEDLHPEGDFAINETLQEEYKNGFYATFRSSRSGTEPEDREGITGLPMIFIPGAYYPKDTTRTETVPKKSSFYKEPVIFESRDEDNNGNVVFGGRGFVVRSYARANCTLTITIEELQKLVPPPPPPRPRFRRSTTRRSSFTRRSFSARRLMQTRN
ncbi:MAG: hypothetical protein OXC40_04575 [Proteobacteria bacterium]|nr:hypothetical protein [Pseudomonadota bacterium]